MRIVTLTHWILENVIRLFPGTPLISHGPVEPVDSLSRGSTQSPGFQHLPDQNQLRSFSWKMHVSAPAPELCAVSVCFKIFPDILRCSQD